MNTTIKLLENKNDNFHNDNNISLYEIKLLKINPCLKFRENFKVENKEEKYNEIFEVFSSRKDGKEYLISPNYKTNRINIISINGNKIIKELEGHECHITSIRYFVNNKTNNEYLISADKSNLVIVWDISNNYQICHKIQTDYKDYILSCLLIFNIEISSTKVNNYIVISCSCIGFTKLYSFDNGLFLKNIQNTENNLTNYLLLWKNKKDENDYIIECCFKKIYIYYLLNNNQLYAELISNNTANSEHFSGIIYTKKDVDLLLVSSSNGYIDVWDLFNKTIYLSININGSRYMDIIQWNEKYTIVTDYVNKSINIIDLTQMKVIGNISGKGIVSVKKIKKINHPKYGQGILSSGYDNYLKLWTL